MTSVFVGLLSIGLTFGIAVFVHEFGHYIFARIRGVGVEAFAIGMGPKIFAWTRHGTEYSIRWLPVGGFVRLHQMVREEAPEQEEEAPAAEDREEEDTESGSRRSIGEAVHSDMEALYDKGIITKLLVFTGGVFFNFLAAMAGYALLFSVGFDVPDPIRWVGELEADSALAKAGLQRDDFFYTIEGEPAEFGEDFSDALELAVETGAGADGLDVEVRREGNVALRLPPYTKETSQEYFSGLQYWEVEPIIGEVNLYKPAQKAGIIEGDRIVAVNGEGITRWSDLVAVIQASLGESTTLTIQREGVADFDVEVTPQESPFEKGQGFIGIGAGSSKFLRVQEGILIASSRAPRRAWEMLVRFATANVEFFRRASFNQIKQEVGGPVMIFSMTYNQAQKGFSDALEFFILLNLILAIMNLLPIPVLDGGFILLSIIEWVTRRPVPPRILQPVYTVFAIGLITLIALITYQDILRALFG
ncbi:RIP metalloprotease RseP [Candidatus Sumerlaeota bacterium]|nr:RIP metalloprotease RseP [Candidatus Sumerlaeota bacterium]